MPSSPPDDDNNARPAELVPAEKKGGCGCNSTEVLRNADLAYKLGREHEYVLAQVRAKPRASLIVLDIATSLALAAATVVVGYTLYKRVLGA